MSSLTFEDLIDQADMPPPGPDYYDARRALWLAPRNSTSPATRTHPPIHQRLTQLLSSPLPLHGDEVWHSGLERVWLSLSSGGRLKQRLPMDMLIKIIHAAWLRDRTWPAGAVAPEPDDVLPNGPSVPIPSFQSMSIPPIKDTPTLL